MIFSIEVIGKAGKASSALVGLGAALSFHQAHLYVDPNLPQKLAENALDGAKK